MLAQTVAKTLIARDEEGRCVRAVIPASSRLDLARLARAVDAKAMSYCPRPISSAPIPSSSSAPCRRSVDRWPTGSSSTGGLAECEHVVLDAGVHDTSLRLRADDLLTVADAQLADIATD